jgi:hypothetical protein
MSEYKKEIGVAGAIAVIVALGVGLFAFAAFPSGPGTTSSASGTSVSNTTGIASTTSPCGSPGVYCGGFNITSASLSVNGIESVLQVTIRETGNMYIGSATVYVNGTVIGNPPASEYEPPGNIPLNVQPRQQVVMVLTIPNSTISIKAGMTYSVLVYAWEGPPGQRASAGDQVSVNVKAG